MNQNLRKVSFFASLSDEALQAVQERLVLRRYRKGDVVFAEGDASESMYMVESGQVAVVSGGKNGKPANIIAYHGPGSFFGEMGVLSGERRSADIRVAIDAELWELHKTDLDALLREHPSIAAIMSRELSMRLNQFIHATEKVASTSIHAVLGRKSVWLAKSLYRVTHEHILILDLGGLWTPRSEIPEEITVETLPDNATPEQLAQRLGDVRSAYGNVRPFDRVLLALPRQETPLTRKAVDLAESVLEIGSSTPWVKRAANEKYWQSDDDDRSIDSTARRITRRRLGLALSSGNARGFAHLGVLRVLEEANIPIDIIAGTSAGALFGGLYCAGYTIDEIEDFARNIKKQIFKLWDLPSRSGLTRGRRALRWLEEDVFKHKTFEQLNIPLRTVSADVLTGEEVVSSTGSVAKAALASFSIPVAMEPAELDGRRVIDGGSVNPVPVSALGKDADIVVAVSVIPSLADRMHRRALLESGRLPNFISIFFGDREIMEAGMVEARMGGTDVLIKPDVTRFSTFQYDAIDELIAEGYRATSEKLPDIQACLRLGRDSKRSGGR
jgi:NTE family protein